MGPRADLDGCGKSRPHLVFDPRTVQPVASRYTDWSVEKYKSATEVLNLMITRHFDFSIKIIKQSL